MKVSKKVQRQEVNKVKTNICGTLLLLCAIFDRNISIFPNTESGWEGLFSFSEKTE